MSSFEHHFHDVPLNDYQIAKQWNMTIEMVRFPSYTMVIFHSFCKHLPEAISMNIPVLSTIDHYHEPLSCHKRLPESSQKSINVYILYLNDRLTPRCPFPGPQRGREDKAPE